MNSQREHTTATRTLILERLESRALLSISHGFENPFASPLAFEPSATQSQEVLSSDRVKREAKSDSDFKQENSLNMKAKARAFLCQSSTQRHP